MSRPLAERVYAALLHLYPRRFREEYGTDMVLLFRDQRRDEPAWRVTLRTLLDLALTVPYQHLETRMHKNPTPVATLGYLTVALAGLLVAVFGGDGTPAVIIGAAVALAAGSLAIVTWRRAAPFRGSVPTAQWWMFVVAGPVLVGAVLVAAELGVDAWIAAMVVIGLAIGSVLVGFALATAGLVARVTNRA